MRLANSRRGPSDFRESSDDLCGRPNLVDAADALTRPHDSKRDVSISRGLPMSNGERLFRVLEFDLAAGPLVCEVGSDRPANVPRWSLRATDEVIDGAFDRVCTIGADDEPLGFVYVESLMCCVES